MSKYTFYGIFMQMMFLTLVLADEGRGQFKSIEDVNISIALKNAKVNETFDKIERLTQFRFAYKKSVLPKQRLNISQKTRSLGDLLRVISSETKLGFKRVNNTIHVKLHEYDKPVSEQIPLPVGEEFEVSGKVTSDDGEPLPGVNIVIKGTTRGTVTSTDGNYNITVPDANAVLVFSSIGYTTEEVVVGSRTTIDIMLVSDIQSLSEIVVVGYGTQKKATVTGAISSVKSDQITALPVLNAQEALQGRAAGVTVVNNGAPGSTPTVRIRGLSTINDNNPLYVIDGIPAGGLNEINPADIESIEILKDASTAAIYGSRGANGVVLITTKKGQAGKTRVDFDMYYGRQSAANELDLLQSSDYIAYATDLQQNAGLPVPARFTDPQWAQYIQRETDWQDEIFQAGTIQNYNVNVSGGGENSTFSISSSYFKQDGIMLNTGFERYTLRANSEFTLGKLKVGQTFTTALSERRDEPLSGGRSQIEHAIKSPPYQPVFEPNNLGGFKGPDQIDNNDAENPVRIARLNQDLRDNTKILATLYGEYEIIDGLRYKLQIGLDAAFGSRNEFSPAFRDGEFHFRDWATMRREKTTFVSPIVTNILTYSTTFAENHNIEVTGVVDYQTSSFERLDGSSINTITSEIEQLNFAEATDLVSSETETVWIGYVARINYNFADRFLLNASIRRDGHSRFGPDNRWGTFPSVSAGWRISEESFMEGVSTISDLKLRASWGQTGNNLLGDYRFVATLQNNFNYHFGDGQLVGGTTAGSLANEELGWERSTMTNVGLDMGFFGDKLRISAEYYNNELDDMLLVIPIAQSLGFTDSSVTANGGSVETSGFEFDIGYRNYDKDFKWSVDFNIGTSTNEVTSLGEGQPIQSFNFEGDNLTRTEEGHPIGSFYGWVTDGLFQTADEVAASPNQDNASPGDIRFQDLAGPEDEDGNPTAADGVIDANDKTFIGNPFPKLTYGLSADLSYKGFDFNVFLTGVAGNDIYNTNIYDLEGMTRVFNAGTAVLNRWTGPNTSNTVPRAVSGDPNRNTRASNRFVEDGSFTRLRNVTIGYSLPESVLSSFANGALSRVRFYISAQNLFTITDYSGYDPEIGSYRGQSRNNNDNNAQNNTTLQFGIDRGNYPQPRTFLGGLQISF